MRKIGDLVLIYYMGKPSVYARIEKIEPDVKEGWYQVELLLLTIPAQIVRWILREEYIDGTIFTMGGIPIRLGDIEIKPLSFKEVEEEVEKESEKKEEEKKSKIPKVIDLQKYKDKTS